jgi:hypothetical protein
MNKMYRPSDPLGYLAIDTTDKFGKRVILEQDRLEEHIIDGHEELRGNVAAIKDSIENPEYIIQSKKNSNRWLYVTKSEFSTYNVPIKTVVEHLSTTEFGYVVTSMFQRRLDPEKEGKILYEREGEI